MQSAKLITRAQTIGVPIPIAKDAEHSSAFTLETRQYDYKKGANPLFRPLSEEDRLKFDSNLYKFYIFYLFFIFIIFIYFLG